MELYWLLAAVILGGVVKGLNGFGYALVSTSILTMVMPAQEAIAFMIIPLIVSNLELTLKISRKDLKACMKRFQSYILASLIGVAAGMVMIDFIPSLLLKKAIGLLIILFVISRVPRASILFSKFTEFCVENRRTEPALGLLSGFVFGSSNIGVPFVTYFKELELPRDEFLSMIGLTVFTASVLRISIASFLGFYTGTGSIFISAALGFPGLIAIKAGDKLGGNLPKKITRRASLLLLLVIAFKLLLTF